MSSITGFVIITAEGKLRGGYGRTAPRIYTTKVSAQSKARFEGDSVLQVDIDLEREPVFIRSKKL